MKKISVFIIILTFVIVFSGCAMRSESNLAPSKGVEQRDYEYAPPAEPGYDGGYYDENQKTIKTGYMSIEVEDFENAISMLRAYVGTDGYIQASNVYKQPSYNNGEMIMLSRGNISIRIHKSKFEAFMANMHTVGLVINESSNQDDISDMYYDTEARHKLLQAEKERLEEYLKEIKDPDLFFKTQSRITDVIYEMERLKGNINKWDDRIEFSTVNIDIKEKHPEEAAAISKPKSFFEKIWDNMKSTVNFMGEAVILLAGLIPVLLVIGIIVLITLVIIRITKKKQ